jgi:hypothetical protein
MAKKLEKSGFESLETELTTVTGESIVPLEDINQIDVDAKLAKNKKGQKSQKGVPSLNKARKGIKHVNLETDDVTISVLELFKSLQQDTRAILETQAGSERRLSEQNTKTLDKIEAVDKRVTELEINSAKNTDVELTSKSMKTLSILCIILILALFGNMLITYLKPTIQVMPVQVQR